jgi:uncharacterized membrane protein YeiH
MVRTTRRGAGAISFAAVDIAATALFGLEGATTGAHAGLDIFGITVVGFATALGGGIIRDVLLGDTPPAAFRSPVRIIVAIAASLLAFAAAALSVTINTFSLEVVDALALALFAATGAQKALEHGSNVWVVILLGAMTGVGGGVVRDVLMHRVPMVLTTNVYATAAAFGALVFFVCARLKLPIQACLAISIVACFALRLAAMIFDWQLPHLSASPH